MNTFSINKQISLTLFFSLSFLLAFGNNNTSVNFINKDSFKDVQQEAKKQNKPIFVNFHAVWCAPCKKVEKEVFHNSEVATFMNENFINYRINIEKGNGPLIALVYEIELLPSVIIVQPNGDVILKKSAYMGSDTFLNWAKEGSNKFSTVKIQHEMKDLSKKSTATKSPNTSTNHPTIIKYSYSNAAIVEKKRLFK